MSLGLWNLQWLNHNSQRSYPIADWATKKCNYSDAIRIPNDFILAINFAISSALTVDIDKFYVKAVAIMQNGASIILGYKGLDSDVAVSHIVVDGSTDIITAALTGINEFDDTVGYIAVGANSEIFRLSPGYYTFDYKDTAIEPDCIRPMLRAVTSLQVQTAGGYSNRMYGDIVLVAGENVQIDILEQSDTRNVLRISAVANQSYDSACQDIDDKVMEAITTINGVSPSPNGNITITGIQCVTVSSGENAIQLEDTCAKPCCGCPELNALEAQIQRFLDGKATLEGFLADLVGGVSALEARVLGGN